MIVINELTGYYFIGLFGQVVFCVAIYIFADVMLLKIAKGRSSKARYNFVAFKSQFFKNCSELLLNFWKKLICLFNPSGRNKSCLYW